MNIPDLDDRIYGFKSIKQGEHANFMMESIEQQEMLKMNLAIYKDSDNTNFNKLNKEIKF